MRKSANETEKQEAIARLKEWIKPSDTIYTILRHVSRSGMQREISLKLMRGPGEAPYHLDGNVALALGNRIGPHDGVVTGGCGMDMGFEMVYRLGRVLWPDGHGCIGEKCRSNDHSNGDRDRTPHECIDERHRTGARDKACPEQCGLSAACVDHWHTDSGYALTQRWL